MIKIEKIEITDEAESFIEISTESDFRYSIKISEKCEFVTVHGNCVKGELSYVGDDCLKN